MDQAGKARLRPARLMARSMARQTSTADPRAAQRSWYRIANKTGEVAEVYIYDEISWWGITAADLVDELREISASRIDVHLNSPGGDVFDGFAIYQALVDHKAEVHVMVDGLAASAASFIAMAGERVEMGQAAMLMIHDAWGLAIGNAADMRDLAQRLDKISGTIAGLYAAHAGGPLDYWRQAMLEETWYDADEAVAAGLADSVRTRKAADGGDGDGDQAAGERPEDSWDLSVFRYAGRAKAPAPKLRPAAQAGPPGPGLPSAALDRPGSVPPALGEPTPTATDVWAEIDDDVFTSLGALLGEAADPFELDADALRAAVTDRATDAPAPPTVQPRTFTDAPNQVSLDAFGQALWEALQ